MERGEGRVERALVERMRDVMTHRGPDDAGDLIFDEGRGGFGFRRLVDHRFVASRPPADARLHRSRLAGFQRRDLQPR